MTPCLMQTNAARLSECSPKKDRAPVSDKSTSANAVTLDRWETLKREFYMRTHRSAPIGSLPPAAAQATVANPNAE
ncbi:MAG: hypothetical protein JWP54_273 [Cryobacterium sp.]|jgi:hypothetical protein|nr:hypothetical protein [Cryobacterium sp.]